MTKPEIKTTRAMGYYQSIGRRLLSVKETARLLGISPKTILNQTGKKSKKPFPVKPKRFGRRILFDVRDVEAYISKI